MSAHAVGLNMNDIQSQIQQDTFTPYHQPQYSEQVNNLDSSNREKSIQYSVVLDPDLLRDNPVEAKHRRLVRSHRNGPLDRDLKPNPKIRDELNVRIYNFFFLGNKKLLTYSVVDLEYHVISSHTNIESRRKRFGLEV